ncbi:MAG: class I SAM-dependent methyltransferase [Flavobacteriaceae bacterium]|nr:class I SAM-dependent methyltransferase [Flavobacteriaceae bacterium]
MNPDILKDEIQDYIFDFSGDSSKLAFRGSPFSEVTVQELLIQIEGRKKVEKKLPTWYETRGILYSKKLNLEQSSSEETAKYKASLVKGERLADLTGGFGVDSFYFAKSFKKVEYYEQDATLAKTVCHNFSILQNENIECFEGNSLEMIEEKYYDCIYVDPARRHDLKGKVFMLSDCEPNIIEHLGFVLDRCKTLIIKTSPMLDISAGLKQLGYVKEIHLVAVENDLKELIWLLEPGYDGEIHIQTIDFTKHGLEKWNVSWNNSEEPSYSQPLSYLYEPNVAIMKSGKFGALSKYFSVNKLHLNSHLFTSEKLVQFPGRRFEIISVMPYSKESMRTLKKTKVNITTRNFPETVANLRKKWKIKEGGNAYLFFSTNINGEKIILQCCKV